MEALVHLSYLPTQYDKYDKYEMFRVRSMIFDHVD
jgi:hypothetical protein